MPNITRAALHRVVNKQVAKAAVGATGNTAVKAKAIAAKMKAGTVAPEGAVVGKVGDVYYKKVGTAIEKVFVKETGTNTNTGWVEKT